MVRKEIQYMDDQYMSVLH